MLSEVAWTTPFPGVIVVPCIDFFSAVAGASSTTPYRDGKVHCILCHIDSCSTIYHLFPRTAVAASSLGGLALIKYYVREDEDT